MKKQYSPMSVDVVKFEAEDVITVSRLSVDPTTPTGDPWVTTGYSKTIADGKGRSIPALVRLPSGRGARPP